MKLIQLQMITYQKSGHSIDKKHISGLYLNVDHITAVHCEKKAGDNQCCIVMSNGFIYETIQSVSEVLDQIAEVSGKE